MYIADWEAGVVEQQVDRIAAEIKSRTPISDVVLVTTHDAIHLWNMGTFMMLRLLQKNNLELKGISLNPYLTGHPVFETYEGYVPFLYWQGFEPDHHVNERLLKVISEAVEYYFPDTDMRTLAYWVNSTNNFGGPDQGIRMAKYLRDAGYKNIVENNYSVSEVWVPKDGMNAVSEIRAEKMVGDGVEELRSWNKNLSFLAIQDLKSISERFPDIVFASK